MLNYSPLTKTNYLAPSIVKLNNYDERSANAVVDTIVIHYTVTDFDLSYKILTAARGVSAHYLIKDNGEIYGLVPEGKKAWHAGVSNWKGIDFINNKSIGIEIVNPGSGEQHCLPMKVNTICSAGECIIDKSLPADCKKNAFTAAQIESLNKLLSCIKTRHNIDDKNIIGHSDITSVDGRKIDPGSAFPWHDLFAHGHGIYSSKYQSNPSKLYDFGDKGNDILKLETNLKLLGYNVNADGVYDKNTQHVVRAFHLHHNQQPEYGWGAWDSNDELKLNDLIESYYA